MADTLPQSSPDFEAALSDLLRAIEEAKAQGQRRVSVPTQTLGGRRMQGARPMTPQEETMADNPARQMGRDAGAFASSAINSAGLGIPGIIVNALAPDAASAIHENERLANPGVGAVGSGVGMVGSGGPLNALGRMGGAGIRAFSELPVFARGAAVAVPAAALPNAISSGELPPDPRSDAALAALRARQDALSQEMAKHSETMAGKTPRPRKQGQPDANERSDPVYFTAKRAYDVAKQQFDAIGGQIGEEQTARTARAQRQQEGDARVADARKNRGAFDAALEDYGPTAGYLLGAGLGAWKGANLAGQFTSKAQTMANDAASTLRPRAAYPARAGGVNDFYTRGGASEVPFPIAPGETPPFRINPAAPQAGELYRQTPVREAVAHAPWAALSGTDAAVGGLTANYYAHEVADAERAMTQDGSPANIARWEDAKRKEAFWETLGNAGRAALLTQAGTGIIPPVVGNRARPPTGLADSERAAVDAWIRSQRPGGGGGPTPLGPQPQPVGPARPALGSETSQAAPAPQVPTGGSGSPQPQPPIAQPKPQAQSADYSSPPPGTKLAKDHEWDDRLTGSKVRAPDGKIAPMSKAKSSGKATSEPDPASEYFKETEGKLLKGSDARPSFFNRLFG